MMPTNDSPMVLQIATYIHSKPFLVQIAKDGKWEQTLTITSAEPFPEEKVTKFLSGEAYTELSIEALFDQKEGVYIFGMSYKKGLKALTSYDFIQTFTSLSFGHTNFHAFIQAMERDIIGSETLFIGDPDKIRIGVVNHWFSVGPCEIWKKGESKNLSKQELQAKLAANPTVLETSLNYQGLSFVFAISSEQNVPTHWIKAPCSVKKDNNWLVSEDMLHHYLADWQQFTILD